MQLETSRLILVPMSKKYTQEMFEGFNESIHEFLSAPLPKHINETEVVVEEFQKQWMNKTEYVFAITDKDNGTFLGLCGLHNMQTKEPHIGIWLVKPAHGKGLGKETVKALFEYAAHTFGLKEIIYAADFRNTPSINIAKYYGGKLIREKESKPTKDGRIQYLNSFIIDLSKY